MGGRFIYCPVSGAEEILIGKILIHLMEVATMNAHEIGQLEVYT